MAPLLSRTSEIPVELPEYSALITVGPSHIPFEIPLSHLTISAFFSRAFFGPFLEAHTLCLHLPDECPKIFAEFVSWLFNDSIYVSTRLSQVQWLDLAKLWVFGDKFQIPRFQNFIVRKLTEKYDTHWKGNIAPSTLHWVYENTVTWSPLRKLFAEMVTCGMGVKIWSSLYDSGTLPDELIHDLREILRRRCIGNAGKHIPPWQKACGREFYEVKEESELFSGV